MRVTRPESPVSLCTNDSAPIAAIAPERAPIVSGPSAASTGTLLARPRTSSVTRGSCPLSGWIGEDSPSAWAVALGTMIPGAEDPPWIEMLRVMLPLSWIRLGAALARSIATRRPPGPTSDAFSSRIGAACSTPGRRCTRRSSRSSKPSESRERSCRLAVPAMPRTIALDESVMLLLAT